MVWQRPHFVSAAGYSTASIKIRRREAENRCSVVFANYFTEFTSLPPRSSRPKSFHPPIVQMTDINDVDVSVSVIRRVLSTMDAYTDLVEAATTHHPAPMLLTLPAEVRLHIYKFIDPRCNLLSAHSGLRGACRQLRIEFEHEMIKDIRQHCRNEVPKYRGIIAIKPRRLINMSDVCTLDVRIILQSWYPNVHPDSTYHHPSCFFWPWLKTLIITFDLRQLHNYPPHMGATILAYTQSPCVYKILDADSELMRKSEVSTVVFRWADLPPDTGVVSPSRTRLFAMFTKAYWRRERSRGHAWSETHRFENRGCISHSIYRRRRRCANRAIKCLSNFLLVLEFSITALRNVLLTVGAIGLLVILPSFFWAFVFIRLEGYLGQNYKGHDARQTRANVFGSMRA
jgi:hypothetical protein